jgi:hypothetical protein
MLATAFDPSPDQWYGAFTVGNRHYEQLMSKTNFATIYDQANFSACKSLEYGSRNWFVSRSHSEGWIVQETAQAVRHAGEARFPRYSLCDFAQMDGSALIQTHQQPSKNAY